MCCNFHLDGGRGSDRVSGDGDSEAFKTRVDREQRF